MAGEVDPEDDTVAAPSSETVAATGTSTERTPRGPAPRLSLPDYEIGTQLGRGGMGEVLLARDPVIDREVAIKRMVDDGDAVAIARFTREAKIQARLEHPAIVPVHEIGTDDNGRPYFTMKKLSGQTLAERLAKPGPKPQKLLRALIDVCHAIDLAHSRSIIHRDLKPSNIMLGDFGEVYVIDWGIARVVGGEDGVSSSGLPASGETQVGSTMGTLGYMAPEQLRDASTAGPAADVYSLGCILYEILAGVAVHPRGAEAMTSTLFDEPRSPSARAPDRQIAPELDALCMKALAFEPHDRPTASVLARAIENFLDGDRDLELRRTKSAAHLAAAREALAAHQREVAAHEAGRAIALMPDSEEAAALVNQIVFTPPPDDELPAELAASLREIDRDTSRKSAGAASNMMFAYYLCIPVLMLAGVASWTWLIVISAVITAISSYARYQAKSGNTNEYTALLGMVIMCTFVSRFAGLFVIMPLIVMIAMMGLGQQADLIKRPWVLIAGGIACFVIPFALEQAGVFEPSFIIEHGYAAVHSEALRIDGAASLWSILFPNLLFTIAAAMFARKIGSERRDARRRTEISAWHLQRVIGVSRKPAAV